MEQLAISAIISRSGNFSQQDVKGIFNGKRSE